MSEEDIGFRFCFPYGVGEGPCSSDEECKENIFCGYENCDEYNCCTNTQLLSPAYPNSYPNNAEKTWLLTAPTGSIISLQFHSFDVRLIVKSKSICIQIFCPTDLKQVFIMLIGWGTIWL